MKAKYQHVARYLCPTCRRITEVIEQYYTPAMKPSPPKCCGARMKKIRHDQSGGL
jgi:hypothetical protein